MAEKPASLTIVAWLIVSFFFVPGFSKGIKQRDYHKACIGKPNGKYVIPDVFKYALCQTGHSLILDCPKNTFYKPEVRNCASPSGGDKAQFCVDRPNGPYLNPWDCTGFFQCYSEKMYEAQCGMGLRFNPEIATCEWERNVPCRVLS